MSPAPGGPQPQRIVSLVPSLTEALFALGLGSRVVGVTDWCVHPADQVAALPKLGGTKNPDLDAIRGLAPDLVIANREENRRRDVERLCQAGIRVWVTYPRTVAEGAELLAELAALGATEDAVERVVAPVQASLRAAQASRTARSAPSAVASVSSPVPPGSGVRYFCPIWRDPWMAVGADTYAHDLLGLCGGENVFANNVDRRYPRVTLEAIEAARPELILLPDEPYDFGPADAAELARLDVPAADAGRIHRIDGTLVSWYGPRIRRALETLRPLFAAARDEGDGPPADRSR